MARVKFNCYGIALVVSVLFVLINTMTSLFKGRLDTFSIVARKAISLHHGYGTPATSGEHDDDKSDDDTALKTLFGQDQQQQHSCPEGFRYFQDHVLPETVTHSSSHDHAQRNNTVTNTSTMKKKIPRVIHIASYSRCLTAKAWTMADSWREQGCYSIHLYDMTAVNKLLHEFSQDDMPHLPLYLNACLPLFGADRQFYVKKNLFKYLVLWNSGGIFVDLVVGNEMNPRDGLLLLENNVSKHDEDDAVMIFDNNNRLPLSAFLAASPRHPLMFLAMATSLHNIGSELRNILPNSSLPDEHTGSVALYEAFQSFMNFDDAIFANNQTDRPSFLLRGGYYTGLEQRTVTVLLHQEQADSNADADANEFLSARWIRQTRDAAAAAPSISSLPSPPSPGLIGPDAPVPQCPPLIYNTIVSTQATARRDIIPLSHLVTGSSSSDKNKTCPPGLLRFEDRVLPESITHTNRKIPKIIHVTGKTRCLSPGFYENLEKWRQLENHSIYFHDDDAVDRLLNNKKWIFEFPHLQFVRQCIHSGAGLADLWRYLVLWEYGGIYSDMDSAPGPYLQNGTAIAADDDAFLIIERGRFLAQYWSAAAPKHPLMFHAAYNALQNLMKLPDIGKQYVPIVTGPRALVDGWEAFLGQRGPSFRYPRPGHYVGRDGNRTATVKGPGRETNRWVKRVAVSSGSKNKGYESMGIVNYRTTQLRSNNVSCYARMLQTANNNMNNKKKKNRATESGLHVVVESSTTWQRTRH